MEPATTSGQLGGGHRECAQHLPSCQFSYLKYPDVHNDDEELQLILVVIRIHVLYITGASLQDARITKLWTSA